MKLGALDGGPVRSVDRGKARPTSGLGRCGVHVNHGEPSTHSSTRSQTEESCDYHETCTAWKNQNAKHAPEYDAASTANHQKASRAALRTPPTRPPERHNLLFSQLLKDGLLDPFQVGLKLRPPNCKPRRRRHPRYPNPEQRQPPKPFRVVRPSADEEGLEGVDPDDRGQPRQDSVGQKQHPVED